MAMGRKLWLFCGSDRGGVRAAAMYTLIGSARLNDVDPQAWLADGVGARRFSAAVFAMWQSRQRVWQPAGSYGSWAGSRFSGMIWSHSTRPARPHRT